MRRLVIGAVAGLALAMSPLVPAAASGPSQISVLALPHPDDETMVASQFQTATSNFQVYITFTRGEQTQYCVPSQYANSYNPDLGEQPALEAPQGRYSPSCAASRLASQVGFFQQMSQSVPAMPGDFAPAYTTRSFPANGTSIFRDDAGTRIVDRTAVVHVDQQGRGVLVNFNLGDGDLTSGEVSWAISTVLGNKAEFGIPELRVWNIIGAFWAPTTYPGCVGYTHADHRAVHQALWNSRFGARYTAGATCAADRDVRRTGTVNDTYWQAAFGEGGAFSTNYGWLKPGEWQADPVGQTTHFHGPQTFWQR